MIHFHENSNVGFVYNLSSGNFTFVSQELTDLSGFNSDTITLETLISAIHPDDRNMVEISLEAFLNKTFSGSLEFRMRLKDLEKWIRVTPFLLSEDGNVNIVVNVSDQTAEVHNFNSIRKYANKKNSILHMLSHDLRGPLGIANNITKIIGKAVTDPKLIPLTETMSKLVKQCIDLIADLLNREYLETTEVDLSKNRIDIVNKVREYISECSRSEDEAKRVFNFSSSNDSIYIELDEAKFMQILNNLVANSLKFTHPNGIINVTINDQNDSVLLIFNDNGIGIPQQFHTSIFDKFTKARRRGLNGEPTVGLGLSIVHTIVEWHRGKIWFESEENKGTTFYLEFPKTTDSVIDSK